MFKRSLEKAGAPADGADGRGGADGLRRVHAVAYAWWRRVSRPRRSPTVTVMTEAGAWRRRRWRQQPTTSRWETSMNGPPGVESRALHVKCLGCRSSMSPLTGAWTCSARAKWCQSACRRWKRGCRRAALRMGRSAPSWAKIMMGGHSDLRGAHHPHGRARVCDWRRARARRRSPGRRRSSRLAARCASSRRSPTPCAWRSWA